MFVTKPGPFTELVANAVAEVTGRKPELSTTGGTSDARFITAFCPVVEFGLVGQTMHQVDERVPIADLRALTTIYRKIVDKYFHCILCRESSLPLLAAGRAWRGTLNWPQNQ